MESRLSDESVRLVLDAGHQSLPWEPGQPSGFLAGIDLDMVLASPQAKKMLQAMPVQPLYYAMKQRGLADCLAVLPLLSKEQVIRMLDYDVWQKDELVPKRAFGFLQYFAEVSPKELYRRFAYLDDEYQLALLSGYFRVYEEVELEDLPEDLQDRVYAMPCNTVFYEILTEDKDELSFLENLMESLKENNLRYAYSLLGHASFQAPAEQEFQLKQFRQARLEEDGFVSYEESLQIYTPINRQEILQRWEQSRLQVRSGAVTQANPVSEDFLGQVLHRALLDGWDIDEQFAIHQNLLYLANALCSAAQVEPDDMYGLNRVLEQCKALVGLGLEYVSQSDIDLALKVIKAEHPKNLFRVGLSLIEDLRSDTIAQCKRLEIKDALDLERHYLGRRWGAMVFAFDRKLREIIGFEAAEILKGLFNRFPMAPQLSADETQIKFRPVASLAILRDLQTEVWSILAFLEMADLAKAKPLDQDIERTLLTATVQALIKKKFVAEALPAASCESFLSMDGELLRSELGSLKGALYHQLTERVLHWAPNLASESYRQAWVLEAVDKNWQQLMDSLLMAHEAGDLRQLVFRS
ncbi:MAG: DUF6178 family protein [Oligoflexus sp.]